VELGDKLTDSSMSFLLLPSFLPSFLPYLFLFVLLEGVSYYASRTSANLVLTSDELTK
jgi:hypothetical protein